MEKNKDFHAELRNRAEETLQGQAKNTPKLSDVEVQHLIYEMRVYQIVLEMQNEELRRAQQDLAEARDRYAELYDFAPAGYFTISEKGIILGVNLAGARMLGVQRSAAVGRAFSLFITQESQERFYQLRKELFQKKDRNSFELDLKRKDGSVFSAQLECTAFRDVKDDSNRIQAVVINVDALKKAEEMVRKLSVAVEQSPAVIAITDLNGNLEYVNPKFSESTGYTRDEAMGKNPRILKSGEQPHEMYKELWKTISSGNVWRGEFHNRRKNGKLFWESASVSPIFDNRGNIVNYIKVAEDISDIRKTNEALWESEALFRLAFENANDGICLLTKDGTVTKVNNRMCEMFGYSKKEFEGMWLNDITYLEDTHITPEFFQKILDGEIEDAVFEKRYVHKQGHIIWGQVSLSTVKGAKGKPSSFISLIQDITQRKQREDQIKRSLTEKEILLGEIHHRVKNNLQIISSLLNLQANKIKDEEFTKMLKESGNRIKSMALIHEKLYESKDFARIDFGGYVKSLARSLIRNYSVSPDKLKLEIEIEDISVGLDNAIPCGLIINELLTNSLKYAFPNGEGGTIMISCRSIKENIELTVSDDGVGLPEGIDVDKTETMGLQLVDLLAKNQLEGEIELDRAGGTSFRIRFRN